MKTCTLTGLITVLFLTASTPVIFAAEPVSKQLFSEVAINGYDPVAYFTMGRAVKGNPKYHLTWQNAQWQFASLKDLQTFQSRPQIYSPQYGGYSAAAIADGKVEPGDPENWQIFNQKLYLNNNPIVHTEWQKNIPVNVRKADLNWPKVFE